MKTSGNTSNIRSHLETVHPEFDQELLLDEPVQKKTKTCDDINEEVRTEQPVTSPSSTSTATDIDSNYFPDSASSFNNSSSVTTTNTIQLV